MSRGSKVTRPVRESSKKSQVLLYASMPRTVEGKSYIKMSLAWWARMPWRSPSAIAFVHPMIISRIRFSSRLPMVTPFRQVRRALGDIVANDLCQDHHGDDHGI